MEEERVYTSSEIIFRVRRKLIEYFDEIARLLEETTTPQPVIPEPTRGLGAVSVATVKDFNRVGVVDGGSGILDLNVGYIGIVSAIGLVIEDNVVAKRFIADPVIVPSDPKLLDELEDPSVVKGVVDKLREALVFETATKITSMDLDLLIIDGPLAPYGALAKQIMSSSLEEEAWRRYREAVLRLHGEAESRGLSVIGFVKRPRSTYLARLGGIRGYDHVYLSSILKPGQFYPDPPLDLSRYKSLFHDPEVADLVARLKVRSTYIRLQESAPPSRVDLGSCVSDYKHVLSYLYATRTRDGIPYLVMKADEETKITRRLLRDLYEDALHEYIVKHAKSKPYMLMPLLPEYGGV